MNNCNLTEDIFEIIISLTSNPWVWFNVNRYFFKSEVILTKILSAKIKPKEKYKFCKLFISCGVECTHDNNHDYFVHVYDTLADDNRWFDLWRYGYDIKFDKIFPTILNVGNRCHQNITSQPFLRAQNVDVRTLFYILAEKL